MNYYIHELFHSRNFTVSYGKALLGGEMEGVGTSLCFATRGMST